MKILKILGILLGLIVVVVLGACAWAFSVATGRYEKRWTAHDATFPIPFPLTAAELDTLRQERLASGADAEDPLAGMDLASFARDRAIERGHHLNDSRLGCYGCHGADFGGGVIIDVPIVAHWAAPNLTVGEGGVTKDFTAHDWDLAVRHGIRHNGRSSSMPCAEFTTLSDHELSDVICYIQSKPAVNKDVGKVRLGPVFAFVAATDPKALSAFTIDHQKPHAVEPPAEEPNVALGEHIVQVCRGCHGPNLSGGKIQGDPNMPIVANLTPHETGIKGWTEADFFRALREGKRPDGSAINPAMPWKSYGQMSDVELKALWAYLQTVPPVPKGTR